MSAGLLKRLGKATAAVLKVIMAPQVGREDMCDAIGYVENAGTPNAAVTPDFIGQWCLDTTNNVWYRAKGVVNTDWVLLGTFGLTEAEIEVLDGVVAGTPAASKAVVLNSAVGIGAFRETGRNLRKQAAQAAKTTSVTLTAAEIMAGLITGNQGGGAAATYTLPLATDLETALLAAHPGLANEDSFDFTIINISTVAAEIITLATNTGWTLVGDLTIAPLIAGDQSCGTFRVRRTAADTYTAYRL